MAFYSRFKKLLATLYSNWSGYTRLTQEAKRLVLTRDPGNESFFEKAIVRFPNSAELNLSFAEYLILHQNPKKAQELLEELIDTHSDDEASMLECAILLERLGDAVRAENWYIQLASSTTPDVAAAANFRLGRVYLFKNEEKAVCFLARSICINGNMHAARQLRARDWEDQDALKQGLLLLLDADEKVKTTGYHLAVSDIAIRLGKNDTATHSAQQATLTNIRNKTRIQLKLGLTSSEIDTLTFPDPPKTQPSFLIMGAMKAGTTSLLNFTNQHPHIVEAVRKEIRGFSFPYLCCKRWYLSHFPPNLPTGTITGEASPGYYSLPIHGQLRAWFPSIKLICILRNPVRRTISHFHHRSFQTFGTIDQEALSTQVKFFEQLSLDDDGMESLLFDQRDVVKRYQIAMSFYYFLLRRWFREFDREQILLLTLRELNERPQETMQRVFRFLGVAEFECDIQIKNVGRYSTPKIARTELEARLGKLFQPSVEKLEAQFNIRLGDL